MSMVLNEVPAWLSTYWLFITLVRLALSLFVIYLFGRMALAARPEALGRGIGLTAAALVGWVAAAIYLGSNNVYRIDENTDLPPLIAYGAGLPILIGYLAFRYWRPLRQIIFAMPQHWLIGLQVYRITGGVFLLLALQGVAPRGLACRQAWATL